MVTTVADPKPAEASDAPNPKWAEEKRREIRLRRSHLLENPAEVAVTYKIASTREELEQSFHLVWDAYVKVGLQDPDTPPIRFTKYHLLPTTKVFVAIHRAELNKEKPDYEKLKEPGEIVGTLTLVRDSMFGLPMEEVCAESVSTIRQEHGAPAEVIGLAVNPEYRSHNVMMYLYKLMFEYARLAGVTDITCSVTKRHIRFYQTMLLFEPMGDLKPYGPANGQEVQCHRLNIDHGRRMAEDVYHSQHFDADLYTFFFTQNEAFGRAAGEGRPMDPAILRYFLEERSRMLDSLSPDDLARLRAAYQSRELDFPY
jgi:GNAT superfamily N-acetyltransferase